MKERFRKIWQVAVPYLNTRHNDIHTKGAIAFAYKLLEREGGDEDIVIPAVILHDVGWIKVPEDLQLKAFGPNATMPEVNRVHEIEGVKIAKELLRKANYDDTRTPEILDIIEGHDSRKEAVSTNDSLVKDADKLWRYCKEAVEINRKRYNHTFEQYIERLRSNLENWFITASAREIAGEEIRNRLTESSFLETDSP